MFRGTIEIKRIHFAFITLMLVIYTCIVSFLFFVLADRFYVSESGKIERVSNVTQHESHASVEVHDNVEGAAPPVQIVSDSQDKPKPFFVKIEGEEVKLFKDGVFEKNLNIDPITLRRNDYAMLVEGISVDTEEQLLILIEDFTS